MYSSKPFTPTMFNQVKRMERLTLEVVKRQQVQQLCLKRFERTWGKLRRFFPLIQMQLHEGTHWPQVMPDLSGWVEGELKVVTVSVGSSLFLVHLKKEAGCVKLRYVSL
jgi:hypothetical protein